MTPTRFGAPGRQLFGLYQPPAPGAEQAQGVVLCNPFGQEAIRCHRLLRVLADRLARAGFPVLRFDYRATGDSDGEDAEADWDGWLDDVLRADEEVRRLSGRASSSWFGLRLGGTLASLASARARVSRLVLWDPVADGAAYLAEIARATDEALRVALVGDVTGKRAILPAPGGGEALGFPLSPALRERLMGLSPRDFGACRAGRVFVLGDVEGPPLASLIAALRAARTDVAARRVDTRIVWASGEAMNTAIVPAEPLQAIVDALATP